MYRSSKTFSTVSGFKRYHWFMHLTVFFFKRQYNLHAYKLSKVERRIMYSGPGVASLKVEYLLPLEWILDYYVDKHPNIDRAHIGNCNSSRKNCSRVANIAKHEIYSVNSRSISKCPVPKIFIFRTVYALQDLFCAFSFSPTIVATTPRNETARISEFQ